MSPNPAGMIASLPYANRNGVFSIGVLGVVLYAYSMLSSSSGHTLFAPSSQVLIILSKDRFVTSTCPLAWGLAWRSSGSWFLIVRKIPEGVFVKLFPVIWDQDSRDPIPINDIFPDKASHVLFCYGGPGFSFYLFGEIVYADYKEL